MKCFEIDLCSLLKVTMLNKTEQIPAKQHITRYIREYIVYVVKSGMLSLLQDGKPLELFPGDVYIFDKGEFQKPLKNTQCEFYYLHFETELVSRKELTDEQYCDTIRQRKLDFMKADIFGLHSYDHMKVLLRQRMHIGDKARLENLITMFKANTISYGYNTPEWRLSISHGAAGILMKLESIEFDELEKETPGRSGRVYKGVQKIADYVEEHFRENFGSQDVERDLQINYDYANRIFKQHMGCSIIKYRNRLRINTAKTLVSAKNLDDVAAEVGFGDRYYFSRCFKNYEGISPDEYREIVRKRKESEKAE